VLQKKPRQSGSSKMYARILVSRRTQFNTGQTQSRKQLRNLLQTTEDY